jgi:type 2 lantibiotic biosynthesis protein LanM
MTTTDVQTWYRWFPELGGRDEVDALVHRISGTDLPGLGRAERTCPVRETSGQNDVTETLLASWSGDAPPFLRFCIGLVADRLARLRQVLRGSPVVADPQAALGHLVEGLVGQLQRTALRSLVEMLHEYATDGRLSGATPEERYEHFERLLDEPEHARRFAATYPLAVEAAHRIAERLCANTAVLLSQTAEHRAALTAGLGIGEGARITRIEPSAGDAHRGGRSVTMLTFDDGSRAVYKPRPLGVDTAYNELLRRLDAACPALDLAVLAVVEGDDCGWVEHLTPGPHPEPDALPAFYRATGRLMALLHLLRANDLHHENFLRHGGRPVLVDVETLLTTVSRQDQGPEDRRAIDELLGTVHSLGMLPTLLENPNKDLPGFDVGALGYRSEQVSPFKSLVLVRPHTDEMRFELRNLTHVAEGPFPPLDDVETEIEELVAGFAELYEWVLAHRPLFRGWVAELFADVQLRYVVENTQRYVQQLRMLTGPRLQQSRPAREALLHRMAIGRDHVDAALIRSEIAQLHHGDVPYFALRSGERHVYDADGPVVRDLLRTSPLDGALAAIDGASSERLQRNDWVTRLSYVGRLPRAQEATSFRFRGPTAAPTPTADRTCPSHLVDTMADRLFTSSLPASGPFPVSWIGARIAQSGAQYWTVAELGLDVYSGAAGAALFLGLAGHSRRRPEWEQLSLSYFRSALALFEQESDSLSILDPGVHAGWPGVVYSALRLSSLVEDEELRVAAVRLWSLLPRHLDAEHPADVLIGSAGVLGASLALSGSTRAAAERAVFDDVAEAAFGHLAASPGLFDAHAASRPGSTPASYSGFAHGVSGVYAYLSRYGAVAGFDEVDPLVDRLLEVERSFFDQGARQWRFGATTDEPAHGWCHGAPGMLLAKAMTAHFDPRRQDALRPDVDLLKALTVERSFGHNPTLCHGDLGNLDILRDSGRLLADDALVAAADAGAREHLDLVTPDCLDRRLSRYALADSLMVGRLGAAHLALRLAAEAPSALWFE